MPETVIVYILLASAASFASALSVWLLSRPTAARARAERGWMYLEAGRWQFCHLVMAFFVPAFLLAVNLSQKFPPASGGGYSSVVTIVFSMYAIWKANEICFTSVRWNKAGIFKTGVFSRPTSVRFDDLVSIDVVEGREATLTSVQGNRFKLDSRLHGAPELIETCRRRIAENTAVTANATGAGSTATTG